MNQDKHKADSWDDLKKWLKRLKKTEPNLKKFADMILGGMKDILKARQEQGEIIGSCYRGGREMRRNRFIKNQIKDRVETMKMEPLKPCRVMWTLVDGSELGVEVEANKHDTDEIIRERAWQHIMIWIHPVLRPRNKSDIRVIRSKKK